MSRSSALRLMLKANTVRVARSSSANSRSRSRCSRTSGGVGERLQLAVGQRTAVGSVHIQSTGGAHSTAEEHQAQSDSRR